MDIRNFERVYMQYRDMVMRIAYDVLKDYHLAQDVCQEVFFTLSEKRLASMGISDETKNFLAVVASNKAIDEYRKRNRLGEVVIDESYNSVTEMTIDEITDQRSVLSTVLKDLKNNHPDWYDVIIHVCFYEESRKIAARKLGIHETTLGTRYYRAKKYIDKTYGKDFYEIIT